MHLPRPYLSYSQLRVWLDNKDAYRRQYYLGEPSHVSIYTVFGGKVAKGIEHGTISIPNLPLLPVKEKRMLVHIEDVPFLGYLDQFDPGTFSFRETKTGIRKPDNSPRWRQRDVEKHIQLDVYSLLIEEEFGQVDDLCHLDWLETRFKEDVVEWGGLPLVSKTNELELTGEVYSFKRTITPEERADMKQLIVKTANEISEDYSSFLRNQANNPA